MKSLLPWFCLVATAGTQVALAADGIDAYRQGNYTLAAENLAPRVDNDPVANYYLGMMRLYGYGELKNNTMALRYFTESANKGFLPAQQLLANYYLDEAKNPELALQWYKKAAEKNDIAAQMYCAAAYQFGYGAKKNTDTARRYFIDAAKNGNDIAQYALGMQFLESRDSRNKKMGVIWLSKSADKGNIKAQYELGQMYATGGVVAQDSVKAKALLEGAASKNYIPAMLSLGNMAAKEGDFQTAKDWLSRAADSKNPDAQRSLASLYLDDKGPFYNSQTGVSLLTEAARQGSSDAQLALSRLYKEGKGVEANSELATKWADAAAKSSSAKTPSADVSVQVANWLSNDTSNNISQGAYRLGGIYTDWHNPSALQQNTYNQSPQMDVITRKALYKPQFVTVKPAEVPINDYFNVLAPNLAGIQPAKWHYPRYPMDSDIEALQRNDSRVLNHDTGKPMVDTETTYVSEYKVEPFDYFAEKSEGWERAANYQAVLSRLYGQAILGNPEAQFNLGQLYQYGIGVVKSPEQAITYFQLAAEQQDVQAEYNLGLIYLEGQTTPVDYQKGIDWMTDAAFKGNPYAQYVLANIYENGLTDQAGAVVIAPDHQQAMSMYYLASANHFADAEYRLADLFVKEKTAGLSVVAQENRNKLIKRLYQSAANQGVAEAVLPLAFYDAMDSDPVKQSHAFDVARQEARAGDPMAALLLAMMYERGISVPADQVEAIYWYQQAGKNPVSQFVLGTYFSEGIGLTKDSDKGRDLLQQAANAGFSYANLNLAVLNHENGQAFLDELEKARQAGNSKAGLLLADYYLLEANNPEKMKQASDIYQYLAQKGNRDAQLKLAFLLERGLGGVANNEQAAQWYTLAAEQGQPVAQYLLAQMYQMGRVGAEPDYAETKKWYKAAQAQFPQASVALGFVQETVDNDYASAMQNYQRAAETGDAIAQYNLGLIYENGKGVPVDNKKAMILFEKSAQQGHARSMTQLAGLYFKGQDGKRDDQQALYWYKKAASLGESGALYQLGLFSETGVIIPLNFPDALSFYQQSADHGNDKAKLALARMYQYGHGTTKDYQHAVDIYKELASRNNAYAQYQLAVIYIEGHLGQRQLQQGRELLVKADANGNPEAGKMLQWLDAQQQPKVSFIEPIPAQAVAVRTGQQPDMMYMEAINEWNRGDETLSRLILNRLVKTYPNYDPARQAVEQLNQQERETGKTVG
ncbi:tetratricopeptide repeat protein [Legionella sp. CNM-4043-24]|uniref:tetratricopeptide repeat protein n=1 Tax=Legionella sp. CNM-4043-24 TaxID=3421646 RepID=UPI00403AFD63